MYGFPTQWGKYSDNYRTKMPYQHMRGKNQVPNAINRSMDAKIWKHWQIIKENTTRV